MTSDALVEEHGCDVAGEGGWLEIGNDAANGRRGRGGHASILDHRLQRVLELVTCGPLPVETDIDVAVVDASPIKNATAVVSQRDFGRNRDAEPFDEGVLGVANRLELIAELLRVRANGLGRFARVDVD